MPQLNSSTVADQGYTIKFRKSRKNYKMKIVSAFQISKRHKTGNLSLSLTIPTID